MQTIIWAFGAMLLSLLVMSFLSLGFNLKGKLAVALLSFVIALGGLFAVNFVALWQILLLLFVLTFFVSYIMDSRLGRALYNTSSGEEVIVEEFELTFSNQQTENKSEYDLLDLDEIEAAPASEINVTASLIPSESEQIQNLDDDSEDIFIQESDLEAIDVKETPLEVAPGYLSEIENLLLEETDKIADSAEDDWLSELADLEAKEDKETSNEENQLDDGELELLFGFEEAAAAANVETEDKGSNKKIELVKN
ncbi:hypothetical protein [Neobacillus niacini]|uniref:hypothetical protein n=1 Tax=Neobacillus niacini TaxID=86668 RepID=UPI001C8E5C13|nr:hypothetical protein [Neobacillus niacini]MBY0146686.1 hypothetical protein [Neobacillus niacini]